MDSCPWTVVHVIQSMDKCPLVHGFLAITCRLTVCPFSNALFCDQNCPRDLYLSRKILTILHTFSDPVSVLETCLDTAGTKYVVAGRFSSKTTSTGQMIGPSLVS